MLRDFQCFRLLCRLDCLLKFRDFIVTDDYGGFSNYVLDLVGDEVAVNLCFLAKLSGQSWFVHQGLALVDIVFAIVIENVAEGFETVSEGLHELLGHDRVETERPH